MLILPVMIFLLSRSASAQNVVFVDVDATGSNNGTSWANAYTDLQDALAHAADPPPNEEVDEIWVAEGTYTPTSGACNPGCETAIAFELVDGVEMYGGFDATETVRDDRHVLNNVTILSGDRLGNDGTGFTNRSDNSQQVIRATDLDSNTIVDGFTIRGGHGGPGAGAFIDGSSLTTLGPLFKNCKFTDNDATNGGAVACDDITLNMRDCTIMENFASSNGGGIYAEAAILRDCTIENNYSADRETSQIHITGDCMLVDCTITNSAPRSRGVVAAIAQLMSTLASQRFDG